MAKRVRGGRLAGVSNQELELELRRRQRGVGKLQRKHAAWSRKLEALEVQIMAMGGWASGRGRGRPRRGGGTRPHNSMTLVEALAKSLKGRTLSVTDLSRVVQDEGYKTNAENFRTMVNQALTRETGTFKRVSRGKYTAK
jgi:hypothetical protein